eukprot:scaffold67376_cov31-Tisochrysis_lutea.AAC.3
MSRRNERTLAPASCTAKERHPRAWLSSLLHARWCAQNSPYDIFMGKGDFKVLCRQELTQKQTALLSKRIKEDYRVHLIMDNLPVGSPGPEGADASLCAHFCAWDCCQMF